MLLQGFCITSWDSHPHTTLFQVFIGNTGVSLAVTLQPLDERLHREVKVKPS